MSLVIKELKLSRQLHTILSLGFFTIAFLLAWSFIGPRALPWWVDGGQWLKYARGLLDELWPMWDESPLNYPPLFPSMLAGILSITGDPSLSIKILATLVFALRSPAAYLFSIWVFRNSFAAFSAATMMLMLPIHVEILGWGGYPNLLCLSIMMIAMTSLISWVRGDRIALPILASTSLMMAFGHSLVMLIYLTTLFILIAASLILRRFKITLKILVPASITLGVYIIYNLAFLWPPRYVLNNEAAYYHLKVIITSGLLTWIFKSGWSLLLLYALMAFTISVALIRRKYLLEIGVLAAWLISPLLLINIHEFRIALDYQRIFFFFVDPFILLASSTPVFVLGGSSSIDTPEFERLKSWLSKALGFKLMHRLWKLAQVLIMLGVIAACLLSLSYGYGTFVSVNGWYNYRDAYGDSEKLEALKWIEYNTLSKSVFVAEEEIGRWIEGYSSRRALLYVHPMYLFIKGEQERAYAARAIFLSSLYLTNGAAAVYETHDPRENMSTRIALKTLGALETLFFLEANSSYVEVESEGRVYREYISEAKRLDMLEGTQDVRIRYVLDHSIVEKVLKVEPGSPEASLLFKVEPHNFSITVKRLVVEVKPWPEMEVWEINVKPNGELLLTTNLGPILVMTNASTAFPFIFETVHEAIISFLSVEGAGGAEEVKLIRSKDLMKEYGAHYVVIPRIQEKKFERFINLKPVTRPEYMHLLADPSYEIAYQNERVIILEVVEK